MKLPRGMSFVTVRFHHPISIIYWSHGENAVRCECRQWSVAANRVVTVWIVNDFSQSFLIHMKCNSAACCCWIGAIDRRNGRPHDTEWSGRGWEKAYAGTQSPQKILTVSIRSRVRGSWRDSVAQLWQLSNGNETVRQENVAAKIKLAVAHKCGMSAAQQSTIKRTSTTTTRPTSNFQDGIERASPTNAIFIHSPWIPIPKARPGVNTQHRHSSSTTKTSRRNSSPSPKYANKASNGGILHTWKGESELRRSRPCVACLRRQSFGCSVVSFGRSLWSFAFALIVRVRSCRCGGWRCGGGWWDEVSPKSENSRFFKFNSIYFPLKVNISFVFPGSVEL